MDGFKHIISCLFFVFIITMFNFYRGVIKREKEIKKQREIKFDNSLEMNDEDDRINHHLNNNWLQYEINNFPFKMLEYDGKCLDIHAIIFNPKHEQQYQTINDKSSSSGGGGGDGGGGATISDWDKKYKNNEQHEKIIYNKNEKIIVADGCNDFPEYEPTTTTQSDTNLVKEKPLVVAPTNNSIIYVFIVILLISLMKAAFDISKHLKEKNNPSDENEHLRRCSLQEYSLMQHRKKSNQRNGSGSGGGVGGGVVNRSVVGSSGANASSAVIKKISPTLLKAQRSFDVNYSSNNNKKKFTYNSSSAKHLKNEFGINIINNGSGGGGSGFTNSIGSGIITEPGSPAKPGKLLAGRPVPLIRRSSVPIFMNKNFNGLGKSRRPSMDSFSEDDTSPKRVRMINRH